MAWSAEALRQCASFTGVLLATGHHLFYSNLAGSNAPTGAYNIGGTDISKQQFNTAVGTTFAFLVKASLTLAVSIAYTQAFWHSAKGSQKGRQLSTLDTMYSALSNILNFFQVHVWVKYPLLLLLAVIVWLIPLASIITPATLSVRTAPQVPLLSKMEEVPQLGLSSMNFVSPMPVGGLTGSRRNATAYCCAGPNVIVDRVAAAVGAQGRMLQIPIAAPNASWNIQFWGPSLQCSSVEGQEREVIWENIYDYMREGKPDGKRDPCVESPAYIAWTPSPLQLVPYDMQGKNSSNWFVRPPNITDASRAAFYVTVLPEAFNNVDMPSSTIRGGCRLAGQIYNYTYAQALGDKQFGIWEPHDVKDLVRGYFGTSLLLRCDFHNTSYSANFDVKNGEQTVAIDFQDIAGPLEPLTCVQGPLLFTNGFGNNWDNPEHENASCSTLNDVGQTCLYDTRIAPALSHQGIADAFVTMISGWIGYQPIGEPPLVGYNSGIAKTVLLDTDELSFIQTQQTRSVNMDLATMLQEESANHDPYIGLSNNKTIGSRASLKEALEDMFTNITISLLSEQNLWPNYTSGFAPERLVNVTYPAYENIYVYSYKTLWIAYGIAISFSLLAVALGVVILCLNGAAYDSSFSLILRVSRCARMSEEVPAGEGDGALPLSRHLAKARVVMYDGVDGQSSTGKTSESDLETVEETAGGRPVGPGTALL